MRPGMPILKGYTGYTINNVLKPKKRPIYQHLGKTRNKHMGTGRRSSD